MVEDSLQEALGWTQKVKNPNLRPTMEQNIERQKPTKRVYNWTNIL